MKKIIKAALTAAITCLTAVVMSVCVFAETETEDVELGVASARKTNGAWGQSVEYTRNVFDCSRITPESQVLVEFELYEVWDSGSPIEFVLHDFVGAENEVWAPVFPEEYTDTSAVFTYQELVDGFGGGNLADVDKIYVGDCGVVMKVTKLTITNCVKDGNSVATTAATTEKKEEQTEEVTSAAEEQAAETTAVQTVESDSEKSGGIPIIPIAIVTVVVAAVVVTVIVVRKNRGRFY